MMMLRPTIAGAAFALLSATPAFAQASAPAPAAPASPQGPVQAQGQAPAAAQIAPGVPRSSNGIVELFNMMAVGSGTRMAPAGAATPAPAAKVPIVIPAAPATKERHQRRKASRHHTRRHAVAVHHSRHQRRATKAASVPAPVPAPAPPKAVPVHTIAVAPQPKPAEDIKSGRAAAAPTPGMPPTDAVSRRFQKASAGPVKVPDPQKLRLGLSEAGRKIAAERQRHAQQAPAAQPADAR